LVFFRRASVVFLRALGRGAGVGGKYLKNRLVCVQRGVTGNGRIPGRMIHLPGAATRRAVILLRGFLTERGR